MKVLLIIECVTRYDWKKIFQGATVQTPKISSITETKLMQVVETKDYQQEDEECEEEVHIEQATWDEISLVSYPGNLVVTAAASERPTVRLQRTFCPDFVLMRSESKGHWGQDSTNKLFTLMHSGIPSVNSLFSIYCFLQKPVIWTALKEIEKKVGCLNFPLVSQNFYPSFREIVIYPSLPCVGKVGSFDAGKGKAVLRTVEALEDFKSVISVQPAYTTLEEFIDWDWDGRVQIIGPHIRIFKRQTESWKGNAGQAALIEDLEVTPLWQSWADECRQIFGGLEMFGLDFVHSSKTGVYTILELNGTACGLVQRHEEEDMLRIRDVVLSKMKVHFCSASKSKTSQPVCSSDTAVTTAVLQEEIKRLTQENRNLTSENRTLKKELQVKPKRFSFFTR